VCVHIRPGVLHLACFQQDGRHHLVDLRDQFEHGKVRQVLECELSLGDISRVRLSKDRVSVAWDHLARLEGLPDEILHLVVGQVCADLFHQLGDEDEHLLVGQAVQRARQTVHPASEGEIRIRERAADQVDCVCTHVATLVVTGKAEDKKSVEQLTAFTNSPMNSQIQAHQFGEVCILVAQHGSEIVRPILIWVNGTDGGAVPIQITVNCRRNGGQLGNESHCILVAIFPIGALVHSVRVSFGEFFCMTREFHAIPSTRRIKSLKKDE